MPILSAPNAPVINPNPTLSDVFACFGVRDYLEIGGTTIIAPIIGVLVGGINKAGYHPIKSYAFVGFTAGLVKTSSIHYFRLRGYVRQSYFKESQKFWDERNQTWLSPSVLESDKKQ